MQIVFYWQNVGNFYDKPNFNNIGDKLNFKYFAGLGASVHVIAICKLIWNSINAIASGEY